MTSRREAPHHNTLTCYTRYGCRLPACVERRQRWADERNTAIRNGTWQPYVDAAPVRQHIKTLLAAGLTQERIAALAAMPHQSVADFTGGISGRGIRHHTSPDIAARILAIDPAVASPVRVNATGTHRRIQALVAIGWPLTHISLRSGLHSTRVDQILRSDIIRIETRQRIQDGYDALRSRKPERYGVPENKAALARKRAKAKHWPPPKYWAKFPNAIDDPHFTPEYGMTKPELRAEEAVWLVNTAGLPRTEVAARLGMTFGEVDDALAYAAAA